MSVSFQITKYAHFIPILHHVFVNYEPLIQAINLFKRAVEEEVHYPPYEQTGWDWADDERISHSFPYERRRTLMFTQKEADMAPAKMVPIDKLIATQKWIRRERIHSELSGAPDPYPGGPLPLVVKENGKYYIQDGHHRLEIAKMQNHPYSLVRLIDRDQTKNRL